MNKESPFPSEKEEEIEEIGSVELLYRVVEVQDWIWIDSPV